MLKFGRQHASESTMNTGAMRRAGKSADPAQLVKQRARQRLIGAIILVLTAIIVVPMVLDSEPRPLNRDVVITIPAKDAPFNPKLDTGAKAPAAIGNGSSSASDTVPVAPSDAGAVKSVDVGSSVQPAVASVVPPTVDASRSSIDKSGEKIAPRPVEKGVGASSAAQAEAGPAKHDDGQKALALLQGKGDTGSLTSAGKLFVQVGAFASEEKVRELQTRLRTAGVPTFTEKIRTDAGERIRLRVGPFGARADAEAALGKIRAAGINGAAVVQ